MKITAQLLLLGPLQYKEKVGNGDFLLFYYLIIRNYKSIDLNLDIDMPNSEYLSREIYPTSSNRFGKNNSELATLYSYSNEYLSQKESDFKIWKLSAQQECHRFPINIGKSIIKSIQEAREARYLREYLVEKHTTLNEKLQLELQRNYSNYVELSDAIKMAMIELRDFYQNSDNYNSVSISVAKVNYDKSTDVITLLVKDNNGRENVIEIPTKNYSDQSKKWDDILNSQYKKRKKRFL